MRAAHGNRADGRGSKLAAEGVIRSAWWNPRRLDAADGGKKRAWLGEELETSRPAVLAMCEVGGGRDKLRSLRAWASKEHRYEMRFIVGEGKGGGGGAQDLQLNGIVALVDKAQGAFVHAQGSGLEGDGQGGVERPLVAGAP